MSTDFTISVQESCKKAISWEIKFFFGMAGDRQLKPEIKTIKYREHYYYYDRIKGISVLLLLIVTWNDSRSNIHLPACLRPIF